MPEGGSLFVSRRGSISISAKDLFAEPSFIEGMARITDFGVTLQMYNEHMTPEEADYNALLRDWKAVGNDINVAISSYAQR